MVNVAANSLLKGDAPVLDAQYLYEYAPCGHISFTPGGNIISINQTLLAWLGLADKETAFNKKFSEILSKVGQFYYQMVVLPLLNMQGAVSEINFDIAGAGSSTFPCLFNAVAVKDIGKKVEVINAIIIKITDRKKYESELLNEKKFATEEKKRLEFLANIIPNLIFTASSNGKISFLNDRFYEYFNYSKSAFKQNYFFRRVYAEDRQKTAKLWAECFKEARKFEAEVRLKNGRGTYEWFLIRTVPYKDSTGNTLTWFGSCTNINDHKNKQTLLVNNLNNSLTTAGEIIYKKEKTLKEIAFDQAHTIRMPLANILGLIQVMETADMDEDTKGIYNLLKESANQLDDEIKKIISKTYDH